MGAQPESRTSSGIDVPDILPDRNPETQPDTSAPGEFPFTRSISANLYRDRPWVMGQYSGYSSPRETNARIKRLVAAGQRGFSIALDLPTQIGLDSDDPRARGEVGRVGVPIDTLADIEELLDGIPLGEIEQIRTTANAIGPIAVAMFLAVTEKMGLEPTAFRLLLQNDALKEYVARGTYIFPPRHGLKFSVDAIEHCAREIPTWEPIEFCGYHIRDSGSTAVQELGVALSNARGYLNECRSRGVDISALAPHLFMFLSSGLDVFEEVAKFRVARRMWATMMKEEYGVPEENCGLRIFAYTLGSALPAREPRNNVVRVAYEAMAAVLGGVQTLATSSFDEALGLPSDEAVHLSLRTQQILAHETGIRRVTDPLGGSHYVEWLTDELEARVHDYVNKIDEQGGCLAVLESGWLERELTDSGYTLQRSIEDGERHLVGVNMLRGEESSATAVKAFALRPEAGAEQIERLRLVRDRRDNARVHASLARLRDGAAAGENTVPLLLDSVRAYASIGEMCGTLKEIWGEAGPRP